MQWLFKHNYHSILNIIVNIHNFESIVSMAIIQDAAFNQVITVICNALSMI